MSCGRERGTGPRTWIGNSQERSARLRLPLIAPPPGGASSLHLRYNSTASATARCFARLGTRYFDLEPGRAGPTSIARGIRHLTALGETCPGPEEALIRAAEKSDLGQLQGTRRLVDPSDLIVDPSTHAFEPTPTRSIHVDLVPWPVPYRAIIEASGDNRAAPPVRTTDRPALCNSASPATPGPQIAQTRPQPPRWGDSYRGRVTRLAQPRHDPCGGLVPVSGRPVRRLSPT